MVFKIKPGLILRLALIFLWGTLFILVLQRDYFVKTLDFKESQILKRSQEESFLGIYFKNERIGYVKNRLFKDETNQVNLQQDAFLKLNILNQNHPVRMEITAQLTEGFLLQKFVFDLSAPFYKMQAKGTVDDHLVRFTLNTGKDTITDTIRLNSPPFLATNQRGYLLKQNLKKGDKIKVPYFDPVSLSGKDTIMEYKGRQKILIQGRIHNLHHFTETFSGIRINSWLNDQGKVIKEESPAGFVFIAEPKFKATSIAAKGSEILSAVSAPLIGTMPNIKNLHRLSYKITLPEDTDFTLHKDRQTFNNNILTISMETLPDTNTRACEESHEELSATPYVQSNHKKITNLSNALTQETQHPIEKIKILAKWVYENLEKRPVLGIPDALTTIHSRKGDCNEHAALFAALARSIQIPTRIVAGVTFHNNAFYYHAWNEVCLNNKWISLDTTKNQLPADITHIKFVEGEIQEMIKISALLGKLQIEVMNKGD